MPDAELPVLRWGIVATGFISTWFTEDLVLPRSEAKARHIITAIGSSSLDKGRAFAAKNCPAATPTIYATYAEVFADPAVDIVYIGTPHAFHAGNCLDAIAAGKHVLCEKAFALTASDARRVFDAARSRGVFVMEAMWTRFFPLVQTLQELVHRQRAIGRVQRVFCDFGLDMNIEALGPESRLRNPALGAGSLLDIGIYSLTYGLLASDPGIGDQAQRPAAISSCQTLYDGVDVATTLVLQYAQGPQAVLTSCTNFKTARDFCRIEGSEGHIVITGPAASNPEYFTVHSKAKPTTAADSSATTTAAITTRYDFDKPGRGFYYEADAVALDIAAGRVENATMPWAETIRVMEIMDEARRQGGAKFPQDAESGL